MRQYRAPQEAWPTPSGGTHVHDINAPRYRDAQEFHPFDRANNHPGAETSYTHDTYARAVHSGYTLITDSTATEMQDWQAPRYHADSHVYDVGNTPVIDKPYIARTVVGQLQLNIHVHPSMQQAYPPAEMSNEDRIILQRPNPEENVELSVKYMPETGNILVDEISDPRGLVLEAKSGRIYGRDQIQNQEYLSNRRLQEIAERQSLHDPFVRNSLIFARHMGEVNELMYPPQRPAMLLTGYHSVEAAALGAQGLMSPVCPPSISASAQAGGSMLAQGSQAGGVSQAQDQANLAHEMSDPAQGEVQRPVSRAAMKRRDERIDFALRPGVIFLRESRQAFERNYTAAIQEERRLHGLGLPGPPLPGLEKLRVTNVGDVVTEKDESDDDMSAVE